MGLFSLDKVNLTSTHNWNKTPNQTVHQDKSTLCRILQHCDKHATSLPQKRQIRDMENQLGPWNTYTYSFNVILILKISLKLLHMFSSLDMSSKCINEKDFVRLFPHPETCRNRGLFSGRLLSKEGQALLQEPHPVSGLGSTFWVHFCRPVSALRCRLYVVSIRVSILLLSMFLESVEVETSWKKSLVFQTPWFQLFLNLTHKRSF